MALDKTNGNGSSFISDPKAADKVFVPSFISIKDVSEKRGLKVLIYGKSGEGKTHFALTADDPLYIVDTERGTSPLKNKFGAKNIQICEIRFKGAEDNLMEIDEVKAFEEMDSAVNYLTRDSSAKTIVFDSATDLWAYAQSYGKVKIFNLKPEDRVKFRFDWGKINNLHKRIINRLVGCNANVIFTARSQEEYNADGAPSGEFRPQCQKNLAYDVDIIIELKSRVQKVNDKFEKIRVFKIEKCRQNGAIEGKEIENLDFNKLKELISK